MKLKEIITFTLSLFLILSVGFLAFHSEEIGDAATKKPHIYSVKRANQSVTLRWKKVKGCRMYYVYRKVGNKRHFKFLKKVSKKENKYKDEKVAYGKIYTYKLVAVVKGKKLSSLPATMVVNKSFAAPRLINTYTYPKKNKTYVSVAFKTQKKRHYFIYRKNIKGGPWKKVGKIKAKGKRSYYSQKIKRDYKYSVRKVLLDKKGKVLKYGKMDRAGIETMIGIPKINLDQTTLRCKMKWNKVKGVQKYLVYMKVGVDGKYREIKKTTSNSFSSLFFKMLKTKSEIWNSCGGESEKFFADPDCNKYVYSVRGYKNVNGKKIFGNYMRDGEYKVITPNIISVIPDGDNVNFTWHTVPNAHSYRLYVSQDRSSWEKIKTVKAGKRRSQAEKVKKYQDAYYTVRAVIKKNKKTYLSGYDKTYTIKYYGKYRNNNILFIGCSITLGSPYYNVKDIKVKNSYPYRIAQLAGCRYYNPSIPGSTMANPQRGDKPGDKNHRYRLITDVVEHVNKGENTGGGLSPDKNNTQKFEDFDTVFLVAGGNDYSDNIPLGKNDEDIKTYKGALNKTISYIKEANAKRHIEGKKPIKLVWIDFFYSDRVIGHVFERHDRWKFKNKIGKTYRDYQKVLDDVCKEYGDDVCKEYGKEDGVKIILKLKTEKYLNSKTCPYFSSDNLHMTRFTYSQIGSGFTRELIDNRILKPNE